MALAYEASPGPTGAVNARPSVLTEHSVELDAATQAAWRAVAAGTSNCRADELSIEFAARPPFLLAGCLLLQLRYRALQPAEEASWWWAGETEAVSDLKIWCVAGGAEEDDRWIYALGSTKDLDEVLEEKPVFRIDAQTVADYLRVFADFARPAESRLSGKPLLIESTGDIGFWTPLNGLEQSALSECLNANRLLAAEPIKHGFSITGTALLDDQLWRVRYRVYDRDVGGLGEQSARKGEIHVSLLDTEPLLAGLPGNYLRALDARPTDTYARLGYQAEAGGRVRLARPEATAVLRDINRQVLPLVGQDRTTRVYRKPLGFYGLDLIEICGCIQAGQRVDRFVVWEPGFAASLDTRSSWIHELNEQLRIHRHWSLKTAADAVEYLKFFGDFVWGPDGPYTIITRAEDAIHPAADPARAETNPDAGKLLGQDRAPSIEDIIARIGEPTAGERDSDGSWQVTATVFISGALSRAVFKIGGNGAVEMLHLDPLVVWEPRQGMAWKPQENAPAVPVPIGTDEERRLALMTAADCAAAIRAGRDSGSGRPVEISGRIVCGRLDLLGETIGPFTLINCRFRGPVQLGHVNCPGDIDIRNCVFESGLGLSEAALDGRLHLEDVVICGRTELSRQELLIHGNGAALAMSECSARNITFAHVCLDGTLLAQSLQVRGNVELLSVQSLASIDLMSASIGHRMTIGTVSRVMPGCNHGYLDLDYASAQSINLQGIRIVSYLYMKYACIEQSIALEGAHFPAGENTAAEIMPLTVGYQPERPGAEIRLAGGVDLYGTIVEKNFLSLQNVDLACSVDATFVRVGTGIWIEPDMGKPGRNRILGDVELGGAIIPHLLRIRRTDIGGDLSGRGMHAGELRMVGEIALEQAAGDELPTPEFRPLMVGGEIYLQDARVDGEVYVTGVRSGHSLNLRHASIGGDLTLAIDCAQAKERGLAQACDADEGHLLAAFPGGINLRKTTVSGDVVLSGVACAEGLIDMQDSHVQRDIEILPDAGPARALALRLEGLRCEGNVDITGLSLEQGCSESGCRGPRCEVPACEDRPHTGHVIAKGARVAGLLRTAGDGQSARIPGCLDLAFSQIGTLEISVQTFPLAGDCDQVAEACGVILQRSSIGMLTVYVSEEGYPRPLDLRYAEIKWWEFNHRDDSRAADDGLRRSSDNPRDYIALLGGDRGLQRHTWRAIENNLYNWGHEAAADDIHREMRRWLRLRLLEEGPNPGFWNRLLWYPRRVARRVGDWLTDGVTSPMRLLRLMGLWLLLSTYLFSNPGNIGPSEEGYLTLPPGDRYTTAHPDRGNWGLAAGFWTALRFHVPVAAFTARDEWEPANDKPMIIHQGPGMLWRIRWNISAEDYGNLVLIAHWIAWPVVIVLASRKFLRRAQQQ